VIKIQILNTDNLEKIQGGATITTGIWVGIIISAIVVFLSGVIDGITNPDKCN
jgi:hypothetical protein